MAVNLNSRTAENDDAQARLLAAGTIARARADAILIAARAQAAGRDPTWQDWLWGGPGSANIFDRIFGADNGRLVAQSIHDHDPLAGISDAAARAADTANTIASTIKWVGIAAVVVVGAIIALWLVLLFTGAKWAAGILAPIAPSLVQAAARGAVGVA